MKVRFCAECGRLILADFSFCPYCGRRAKGGPGLEEALGAPFERLERSRSRLPVAAESAFAAATSRLEALEAELGEILAVAEPGIDDGGGDEPGSERGPGPGTARERGATTG